MAPSSTDQVNFSQFLASQLDWRHLQCNYHEQWLRCVQQTFETMDKDGDGLISAKDLVQAIGEKVPAEYVSLLADYQYHHEVSPIRVLIPAVRISNVERMCAIEVVF